MSTLAEKLETAHTTTGPARCTAKQMMERWVRVGPDTYELIERMAVTE